MRHARPNLPVTFLASLLVAALLWALGPILGCHDGEPMSEPAGTPWCEHARLLAEATQLSPGLYTQGDRATNESMLLSEDGTYAYYFLGCDELEPSSTGRWTQRGSQAFFAPERGELAPPSPVDLLTLDGRPALHNAKSPGRCFPMVLERPQTSDSPDAPQR